MNRDFYSTMAQVLPVLLLALVWDSGYLDKLRTQTRTRGGSSDQVLIWTKPVVRIYAIFVTAVLVTATALSVLVLANLLSDADWLRVILAVALVMSLATLLVRMATDVIAATHVDTSQGHGVGEGGSPRG